jgi:hypothetical protein
MAIPVVIEGANSLQNSKTKVFLRAFKGLGIMFRFS